MKLLRFVPVRVISMLAALTACGPAQGDSDGATDDLQEGIVNGAPSPDTQNSVVLIRATIEGGKISSCTGTLIADNLVATAHHCVAKALPGVGKAAFACNSKGELTKDLGGGKPGADMDARTISVFPGR